MALTGRPDDPPLAPAAPVIERLHDVSTGNQIDDAVVNERSALHLAVGHGPHPRQAELVHVGAGNLTERAVALSVEGTSPTQPVVGRGIPQ